MALFSNYIPFKESLEKYVLHCKTIFDEIGDRESSRLVEGFIKDFEHHRYNITIVGSLKRGKSTLLNTLMARGNDDISPISSSVCTSAIIKYQDKNCPNNLDAKEKAIIYHDDAPAETVPLRRLREYVTETANPQNRKKVQSVDVFGDFPEWSKAVTIIDSPGQNAVYEYHDILLRNFLPYTDAIIFLVAADLPLDGGDIALLKELTEEEKHKIFFVLTKIDNIDNQEDLNDVIDYVRSKIDEIGLPSDKLYKVSAKPVYDALCRGVNGVELDNLKDENGILELEKDLEQFIVRESESTQNNANRIKMLMNKTLASCNGFINNTEALLNRQDFDIAALTTQQKELVDKNHDLREKTKAALRKFERDWKRAISTFERKFSSKSAVIEDKIIDRLDKGGLIGAIFQSFKLQKKIKQAVILELTPLLSDLEEKLNDVIITLNKEYEDELSLYAKSVSRTDVAAGMSSITAASGMAGTVGLGVYATHGAVTSAMTAYSAWQTASVAAASATAQNSLQAVGFFPKMWQLLAGGEKAAIAATKIADASAAASSAIAAGVSAVLTAGVSIAVSLIVQKLLHIGLVKFQEHRTPGIIEKVMQEMEDSLFKGLDKFKDSIVKDYEQNVEDIINDNNDKINDIKELVVQDNPEERELLSAKVEKVRILIGEGVQLDKQLLLLG